MQLLGNLDSQKRKKNECFQFNPKKKSTHFSVSIRIEEEFFRDLEMRKSVSPIVKMLKFKASILTNEQDLPQKDLENAGKNSVRETLLFRKKMDIFWIIPFQIIF